MPTTGGAFAEACVPPGAPVATVDGALLAAVSACLSAATPLLDTDCDLVIPQYLEATHCPGCLNEIDAKTARDDMCGELAWQTCSELALPGCAGGAAGDEMSAVLERGSAGACPFLCCASLGALQRARAAGLRRRRGARQRGCVSPLVLHCPKRTCTLFGECAVAPLMFGKPPLINVLTLDHLHPQT